MFNTMVMIKSGAALCGALLIFVVGSYVADALYVPVNADAEQAYSIDTGAEEEAAEPEEEPTFAEAFEMADASAGSSVWSLEPGANGVGPYLHGVVGREVGVAEGYNSYSGALNEVAEVWTPENISAFITNPSGWAPGTSMGYSGLDDVQDRANLIAYIQSESDG